VNYMLRISLDEMEQFFEALTATLRSHGVVCAITSGMACVEFGVAFGTKDCDMLCAAESADAFLRSLEATPLRGAACSYRSHLGAPLDCRWLRGGWTSHFAWSLGTEEACLDVFGVAPRASALWQAELMGLYASPHIVAEMKRTDRPRDWPIASALGAKLLYDGDPRGWLHVFDPQLMVKLASEIPCPRELFAQRPVLELLERRDPRLDIAVRGEIEFWQQLDHVRMQVYRNAVRRYVVAVKKDARSDAADLRTQHLSRIEHAEQLLPMNPLKDFGVDCLLSEARRLAERMAPPGSLEWLPDVTSNFVGMEI
jgi:hypothetical protein